MESVVFIISFFLLCPRGEEVWKQGSKDIRDVISLGKLIRKGDGPEEIEGLVKTFAKYTNGTDDN